MLVWDGSLSDHASRSARIRLSGGLPATELDREPFEGLAALVHLAVGGRVLGECERAIDRGQVRRDPQRPDEGQARRTTVASSHAAQSARSSAPPKARPPSSLGETRHVTATGTA